MTTATKITLLRVAMIPAFMAVFLMGYNWAALIIFAVASLTDFVDGYIARHYNQTSDFGKFLDPLADHQSGGGLDPLDGPGVSPVMGVTRDAAGSVAAHFSL